MEVILNCWRRLSTFVFSKVDKMQRNICTLVLFESRRTCRLCLEKHWRQSSICPSCRQYLPINSNCCARCAIPLSVDTHSSVLCPDCLTKEPSFDQALSAYIYDFPIDGLINAIKKQGKWHYLNVLEVRLQRVAMGLARTEEIDWVVSVPVIISKAEPKQNGLPQEMALKISHWINRPYLADCLSKTQVTPKQHGLSRADRKRNIRGVFKVNRYVQGKSILVVDDVMTTGATVEEIAKILKKAGAHRIWVICLARTPKP